MKKKIQLVVVIWGASFVPMAGGVVLGQSLGVTGQNQQGQVTVRPPDPGEPEAPSRVMVYVVALVVGGVAIGLAVMPSRRTHDD